MGLHVHLKRTCTLGFIGCNILKVSIKTNSSILSFRISVVLLFFSLEDLPSDVNGILKSPTIILFPSNSSFITTSICFIYLGVPIFGAYMLMSLIHFLYQFFYHYVIFFFISLQSYFKVYLDCYEYYYPCFLVISICMKYLFSIPSLSISMCPSP